MRTAAIVSGGLVAAGAIAGGIYLATSGGVTSTNMVGGNAVEANVSANAAAPVAQIVTGEPPVDASFLTAHPWSTPNGCANATTIFKADGTLTTGDEIRRWTLAGGQLTSSMAGQTPEVFTVSRSGANLVLTADGRSMTLTPCPVPEASAADPTATPLPPGAASAGGATSPPRQIAGSFSDAGEDYPLSAIRAGESGTTRVSLLIGTDGQVKDCRVTFSSGTLALDLATCSVMRSRYRFQPAMENGQPVEREISMQRVWVLPEA